MRKEISGLFLFRANTGDFSPFFFFVWKLCARHLYFGENERSLRKVCTLFFLLFLSHFSFSQNPLVKQWDYRFGGTSYDFLSSIKQTFDGGYILGGSSNSGISGDKTQSSWGGGDCWVVKIDSLGVKQWDSRFGGIDYDDLSSLQQTTDGGYILGGWSFSGISGDKTQPSWGGSDYWIVKTDSPGVKQWDQRYGGSDYDRLYSLKQTTDGGYILGGWSSSGISGDKTQPSWGGYDYWIVKIDSLGVIQWDQRFGGTDDDYLYSLQQTTDGGYILGGFSNSGIGGDKTQTSWGLNDYWIVKIDSLGVMQWDKRFGGFSHDYLYSLQQTTDGGYILGGYSFSGLSGDKTQPSWGDADYWIVKIDSLGIKQWDKDFGGTSWESDVGNITQTSDGGYLIPGASLSPIGGDKTENNLGVEQTWVVKTDSLGIKQWDKTLFNTGIDGEGYAIQTKDGCFVMANRTDAGIGGDKTQAAWDSTYDYWIVKFCDTFNIATVMDELNADANISISPNPSGGIFFIEWLSDQITDGYAITVRNTLGQIVYSFKEKISGEDFGRMVDLSSLARAFYFLEIKSGEKFFRKKIVIAR